MFPSLQTPAIAHVDRRLDATASAPLPHQDLWEIDRAHALHPWTNFGPFQKEGSLVITKGQGAYLWDVQGKRYFDAVGGLCCTTTASRSFATRPTASTTCPAPTARPGVPGPYFVCIDTGAKNTASTRPKAAAFETAPPMCSIQGRRRQRLLPVARRRRLHRFRTCLCPQYSIRPAATCAFVIPTPG